MGKSYSHINRIKNTHRRNKRRYNELVNQVVKDVVTFLPLGVTVSVANAALGGKG